jgi:hypothetical protein
MKWAWSKWVVQRYRLLDVAERIATGTAVDWADLAFELGYRRSRE